MSNSDITKFKVNKYFKIIMDTLTSQIHNLDSLERHQFKLYVKSCSNNKESKLTEALSLFYRGYTSRAICESLYGSYPNTGYYALRKRLMVLLLEYYAYEKGKELNEKENEVKLFFEAGKNLVLNKSYKLGFNTFHKALSKSKENEFYSLTNKIVLELIQVAHLNTSINLEELIKEFEKYKELENKQNTIAIAYAEVKEKLNNYFLHSNKINTLIEIDIIFKKYNLDIDRDLTYRTLYQLGQLSLSKSTVTRNFIKDLNSFEKRADYLVSNREPKNFNQWIFKFKLLYLLASSNYRAKRFKKSNDYLNQILNKSNSSAISISKEFYFKVTVLKSLNINYLGENEKASLFLDKFLKESKLPKSNKNWLDGFGVMSMILFHGKKYTSILKLYNNFKKSDLQYQEINGLEWVMRKNLILILTHFELGNIEESERLIQLFKIENSSFLDFDKRVLFFLLCLEKVVSNPFQAKNKHFHKFVESNLEKKPRYEEDIFVLSFFAWFKAKMLEEDMYQSTIEIVRNLNY